MCLMVINLTLRNQVTRYKITPIINDPKAICRDVSGLGHWGNGDVELGIKSLDELPYVLGLVRQSLEKQMGELE